jgi:hypothetical protein
MIQPREWLPRLLALLLWPLIMASVLISFLIARIFRLARKKTG